MVSVACSTQDSFSAMASCAQSMRLLKLHVLLLAQ
jgi:hypothetical protein